MRGGRGSRKWRGLLDRVRRSGAEDTDEELRFHFEMRTKEYREKGMAEGEAREAARRRLGDLEAVRREVGQVTRRRWHTLRLREWLSELRQDLRYGVRMLVRAPVFASMAVLTLALGIGATTAIFSVVYAVLLAPLPYAQSDRLVRIWETSPQGAFRNVVSSGNVRDWQERAWSFVHLGAHRNAYPVTLTGDGEPARVIQSALQPEVVWALGMTAAEGRVFTEDDASREDLVLLSHGFWQSRYGGADVVGRRVVLDDVAYTVVGVLRPEYTFPNDEVQLWTSLSDGEVDPAERTSHNYSVVARLAEGATIESAQAEMDAIVARITEEHPAEMTGWGARVVPFHDDLTRNVRSLFWVLLGSVGVVLLIACANLANMLLARAVSRQREVALRGALGAGRGRILRQLLAESVLLAGLGGAGAVVLVPILLKFLIDSAPPDIPLLERAAIDVRMLGFTGVTTLVSAILFGLTPALRLSRADLHSALRGGRDGSIAGHTRLRSALLVAQVALSVVLLVGAGLFVRSFRALQRTDIGFDPEGLVLMDVNVPRARYEETPAQVTFYDRLLERVRSLPGVTAAAATSQPPGSAAGMTFSFAIEGRVASNPTGREDDETLHAITPGYFEVLGQRVVNGRAFDVRDRMDGAPVVIINESLARKHWPAGGAVGSRIAFRAGETPWREIIGVVADARLASPDVVPDPAIYVPFAQKSWPWLTWTTVVARTRAGTDPLSLVEGLRRSLLELDPELPPQSIATVASAFRENTARRRFAMTLISGFGVLALLLSIVGLYGLISYSVARQTHELGVRIALGAHPREIVVRVVGRSLLLTLIGAGGGVLAALAASRLVAGLLYGVSPMDMTTYALTVCMVMAVAVATTSIPAVRAARTDPLSALRADP